MATAVQVPIDTRPTQAQIQEFLQQKRIAFVGVSRNAADFSRKLWDEFAKRGYDVVPVHPGVAEIDGRKCYETVRDVPSVRAALLLTSHEVTEQVVGDCIAAGITHLWMYRATGHGAVSDWAVEQCRVGGINVIAGECPFMFFHHTGFPHRVHGFIRKIFGTYPG